MLDEAGTASESQRGRCCRVAPVEQVVDADDLVALVEEELAEVGAEVDPTPGHQHAHRLGLRPFVTFDDDEVDGRDALAQLDRPLVFG